MPVRRMPATREARMRRGASSAERSRDASRRGVRRRRDRRRGANPAVSLDVEAGREGPLRARRAGCAAVEAAWAGGRCATIRGGRGRARERRRPIHEGLRRVGCGRRGEARRRGRARRSWRYGHGGGLRGARRLAGGSRRWIAGREPRAENDDRVEQPGRRARHAVIVARPAPRENEGVGRWRIRPLDRRPAPARSGPRPPCGRRAREDGLRPTVTRDVTAQLARRRAAPTPAICRGLGPDHRRHDRCSLGE